MQKTLKPIDFMNEMHENEFKIFFKSICFTQNFKNKIMTLFAPKISINEHILCQNHRTYNLEWPNQIHTQFHVLSLVKNNL